MTTKKSPKSLPAAAAAAAPVTDRKTNATIAAKADSKATVIISLLKRDGGATLEEMMDATGWQKHSVRGFMAGALKKRHGLTVTSIKREQGRSYSIADEPQS